MPKRIAGELREAIGNAAAMKGFSFCLSLKVRVAQAVPSCHRCARKVYAGLWVSRWERN